MPQASTERAALIVIAAGVCAALHVGKLAPAIAALQQALGLTLVEAGFLLSGVQIAGMTLGVAFGVVADGLGARRSMVLGLALLALASAAGAVASSVPWLMALRALEGFGFLLVALPAPGLLRRLVPPGRVSLVLGVWGAYMPFGAALALLFGPLWMGWLGWRAWWWLMALLTALMAWVLARGVPPSVTAPGPTLAPGLAWSTRLAHTLSSPGPWLVAVTFAMYSSQWLAVVGFLPTIYTQAGVPGPVMGLLTALAAGVNILGNVGSGRLLQRGAAPQRLLAVGFVVMAVAATAAFAGDVRWRPAPGTALSGGAAVFRRGRADPGHAVLAGRASGTERAHTFHDRGLGPAVVVAGPVLQGRLWSPGWPAWRAAGSTPAWPRGFVPWSD
jgi:CP family cyanate transporter-like MFS transporter